MPTTYAHYIFGSEVLYLLPEKYREIAEKYRSLYDTGVHGPDILFYYDALKKNEVVSYGRRMHFTPARDFFENAKKVYESHEDKEAMMAYILGFLTHFAFDSTAHGYVDRKAEVSEVTHNRVESELRVRNGSRRDRFPDLIRTESTGLRALDRPVSMLLSFPVFSLSMKGSFSRQ